MRRWTGTALLASVALMAGCAGGVADGIAIAVWELDPEQSLGAESTGFTALVTRLGCNSGVTGEVQEPEIVVTDAELVITFEVTPGEPEAANCQGNEIVSYEVALPGPLGDRVIRDGACDLSEPASTVFCEGDGVRFAP